MYSPLNQGQWYPSHAPTPPPLPPPPPLVVVTANVNLLCLVTCVDNPLDPWNIYTLTYKETQLVLILKPLQSILPFLFFFCWPWTRSWARFNIYAYERTFMHCLYFICERKFCSNTLIQNTRGWKSILIFAMKLRNYLWMTKSQLQVRWICLPINTPNVTINKNELWKTVRLQVFKNHCQNCLNLLYIWPSKTPFVFAELNNTFFERFEQLFSMFHSIWCQFSLFNKFHDTAPLTQRTRKDWSFFLLVSRV